MDNRIEKLMNFCEFKLTSRGLIYKDAIVIEDDGHVATKYPEVNLDWLYKYPVAKITATDAYTVMLHTNQGISHAIIMPHYAGDKSFAGWGKKPVEALLEAIIQVIDKEG